MADLIGRIINEYRLMEQLGSGAQASVYRATHRDPDVQHEVAIKIFSAEQSQDPDFMRRIKAEALVVARLDNQNVVPLYNYHQEESGEICLFMRLMRGGSLGKRLRENGPLSVEEILVMLTRIASALAAAHQERIIHGDVKPDNIMFDQQNNVYLSDFGLSRQIKSSMNLNSPNNDGGGGTFGYIAPEQLLGASPKPQSDIFSLGITLYECLTGERPSSDKWYQFSPPLSEIVLPSVRNRRPELSLNLDVIIREATRRDPVQRYSDVLQFVQDVVLAMRNSLPPTTDYGRKKRSDSLSFGIGRIIHNRYKILEKPRIGSNSILYHANDNRTEQQVVIKIIDAEHAQNPDFVLHFRNEAVTVKTLAHPNIVALNTHWFDEDGSLYVVMPYLPGGSLSDRLRDYGPLTIKETIQITSQLSQALAAAHQRNIIHHDIRPANILFDARNNAFLVDFGLPKQHGESSNRVPSNGIGTPGYVAPEQFKDGLSQPQGDIFSLAITLYECLTDHHPFASDRYKYIYQEAEIKLPKVRTRRPDLPVELDAIFRKAMRRDRAQRYDSSLSFAEAIINALEKSPSLSKTPIRKNSSGFINTIRHGHRPRVFISYRRKSSFWLALVLYEKLQNHGIDVFVDREKLDSTIGIPFAETLFQEIETRDVFICLLAEGTLTSDWVKKEIEYAHELQKPMIPVFQETFIKPVSEVEPHIQALMENHGVDAIDKYINDVVPKLAKAIKRLVPNSGRKWKLVAAAAILTFIFLPAMVLVTDVFPKWMFPVTIIDKNTPTQAVSPVPQPTSVPATVLSNTVLPSPTPSYTPTQPPLPTNTPLQITAMLPKATLLPATFVPSDTPQSPTPSSLPMPTSTLMPTTISIPTYTSIPLPTLIPAFERGNIALKIGISHEVIKLEILSMPEGCFDIDVGQVCLDQPFYINTGPIKNSEYRACQHYAHECALPYKPEINYNDLTRDEWPLINVTWQMAYIFCEKLGGQLPTERQWLFAANQLTDMGQLINEWVGTTFEPGSDNDNVTNVSETTLMVIRGDAANQGAARLTQREAELANRPGEIRGFRCVFPVNIESID